MWRSLFIIQLQDTLHNTPYNNNDIKLKLNERDMRNHNGLLRFFTIFISIILLLQYIYVKKCFIFNLHLNIFCFYEIYVHSEKCWLCFSATGCLLNTTHWLKPDICIENHIFHFSHPPSLTPVERAPRTYRMPAPALRGFKDARAHSSCSRPLFHVLRALGAPPPPPLALSQLDFKNLLRENNIIRRFQYAVHAKGSNCGVSSSSWGCCKDDLFLFLNLYYYLRYYCGDLPILKN